MVVDRLVAPRAFGATFVAALSIVVFVTLGGRVPPAVAASSACGAPGADGPQPALGGTVNTYFPGTSSSVAVGGTSLTVGASVGASNPITPGDKLLIIQMQSAVVDSTNTGAYGDGTAGEPPSGATSWASAGTYEFAVAANGVGAAGGTLQLAAGVLNAYSSSAATATMGQQTFQVVRVPRYSSATLGSNVAATPWNGAAGGIVAFDVTGTLDLNGFRIDVSGSGFRGGAARQLGGGAGGANTDVRTAASNAFHGGKAEGAAGTPRYVFDGAAVVDTGIEGYPNGSFARGAPANAGGGGTDGNPAANDQNSGGGGGGNGGAGGQGGNTWSSNLPSGGAGGAAVPTPNTTRLVLGGGGGGGTRNNAGPSSGGRGAGLVVLDVGSLAGSGEIRANGADGETAANDGGGGGGSGGTVVVTSAGGTVAGLTVNANGGKGGDAWPTQPPGGFPGERHGPGGGGGGGVVLISTGGATTSTSGGVHGITTTANDAYNATDGAGGSASSFTGPLPGDGSGSSCPAPQPPAVPRADLSLTKTAAPASARNGDQISYTLAIRNDGPDPAQHVTLTDTLPTGLTFVSVAGDGWTCSVVGVAITCTRSQLASGASSTVTLVVTAAQSGDLTNSATVGSDTNDPNSANGVASAVVQVADKSAPASPTNPTNPITPPHRPAVLRVGVTPALSTVSSGKTTRFVIRTGNSSKIAANGVITCVTIPPGATAVKASGGAIANGRYCWRTATLSPGRSVSHVIWIAADRRQAQRLTLVASARARNAQATFARAIVNVRATATTTSGGYTG